MSEERARKLASQVLELPPSERRLVRALIEAGDDDVVSAAERDAELLVEIRRRKSAVASGASKMLSREEANAMLAARRLSGR
jgi:hypothetical protein